MLLKTIFTIKIVFEEKSIVRKVEKYFSKVEKLVRKYFQSVSGRNIIKCIFIFIRVHLIIFLFEMFFIEVLLSLNVFKTNVS